MHPIVRLLPLALLATSSVASANQVSLFAAKDNTMYAESTSESNGAGDAFFAGVNGFGQVRRALIQFDVASAIPAGSTITGVQLVLFMSKTNAGVFDIALHRSNQDWGEGTSNAPSGEGSGTTAQTGDATWGRRFYPGSSWTTPGGDFVPTPSVLASVNQTGSYTWTSTPAFVADVQSFLDSPSTNFGWVIKCTDEASQPTAKRFWSRQYTGGGPFPTLIVDFTPPGQSTAYCFGDGSGTPCPCANSGAAGNGCANSVDPNGAVLNTTGTASVSSDTLALTGSGMPNGPALYFQGTVKVNSGLGNPFGDGLRCAGGLAVRMAVKVNAAGTSTYPSGPDLPVGVKVGATAGFTGNYQVWYRDSATFCTASTFNLTNGRSVTWIP